MVDDFDWTPLLDKDEKLLWQGRPNRGWFSGTMRQAGVVIAILLFGLVFALAALAGTVQEGAPIHVISLMFAGAALWVIAERHGRRRTRYAVTSKRVLKADARTGRRSGQYTLLPTSRVCMVSGTCFVLQSRKAGAPGTRKPLVAQHHLSQVGMLPMGFPVGPMREAPQAASAINARLRELRDAAKESASPA